MARGERGNMTKASARIRGMQGISATALALALPQSDYHEILTAICYAVVIFSVIVQGLSTGRVARLLYGGKH